MGYFPKAKETVVGLRMMERSYPRRVGCAVVCVELKRTIWKGTKVH